MSVHEYEFHGVRVRFPYPLYEAQKMYLDRLLLALCNGKNALLESPTGTGKTLCLLCGALAWQFAVENKSIPSPAQFHKQSLSSGIAGKTVKKEGRGFPMSTLAWKALAQDKSSIIQQVGGQTYEQVKNVLSQQCPIDKLVETKQLARSEPVCPKIYFMSRTHSQLSQAISELKRTTYVVNAVKLTSNAMNESHLQRPSSLLRSTESSQTENVYQVKNDLKTTIVASRDHLCIHPDLSQLRGAARTAMCQQKLKNHSCHYEGGLSKFKPECLLVPRDIEELRSFGYQNSLCPYYAAKEHVADCHLIFLPYEYILNRSLRRQLKFQLQGSVLIFDEGHNLERAAEEAGSFDLPLSTIQLVIHVLSEFILSNYFNQLDSLCYTDILEGIVKPLAKFCHYIESTQLTESSGHGFSGRSRAFPAEYLFSALERSEIFMKNFPSYESVLSKCSEWVNSCDEAIPALGDLMDLSSSSSNNLIAVFSKALDSLMESLLLLLSVNKDQLAFYRMFVCESTGPAPYRFLPRNGLSTEMHRDKDRILSLWCFTATAVLKDLINQESIHSLIVTSGTLAPLSCYATSLTGDSLISWVSLENVHVVPRQNVSVEIISTHPDLTYPLRFVYQNKANRELFIVLGKILRDVCEKVPGGVVVFFSSYAQLNYVTHCWMNTEFWRQLTICREVIVESMVQTQKDFDRIMAKFKNIEGARNYRRQKKLLFLVVIRGRFSEGLNLADEMCRCVVIVGIPYPAILDPKLDLKQSVLDSSQPNQGSQWYLQQAGRAINQAIGRVIRHSKDFGLILLIDERFMIRQQYEQLSRWVRQSAPSLKSIPYSTTLLNIETFFKRFLPQVHHIPEHATTSIGSAGQSQSLKSSTHIKEASLHNRPRLMRLPKRTPLPLDKRIKKNTSTQLKSQQIQSVSNFLRSVCLMRQILKEDQLPEAPKNTCQMVCGTCGFHSETNEESRVFKKSVRCGHRACESCWSSALTATSACPFCGEITRIEHLRSVDLP